MRNGSLSALILVAGIYTVTCSVEHDLNTTDQTCVDWVFAGKGRLHWNPFVNPMVLFRRDIAASLRPRRGECHRGKRSWTTSSVPWLGGPLTLKMILKIKAAFPRQNNSYRLQEGRSVVLDCQKYIAWVTFSGFPAPGVVWTHNNRTLRNSKSVTIKNSALMINSLKSSDNGVYMCKIQYYLSKPRSLALFTVTVVSDRPDVVVLEDTGIDLTCHSNYALSRLDGFWVRWIHNSTVYVEFKGQKFWSFNNLHIWPVHFWVSGVWECQLINERHRAWTTNRVVVVILPRTSLVFYVIRDKTNTIGYINIAALVTTLYIVITCVRKPLMVVVMGRSLYKYYELRISERPPNSNVISFSEDSWMPEISSETDDYDSYELDSSEEELYYSDGSYGSSDGCDRSSNEHYRSFYEHYDHSWEETEWKSETSDQKWKKTQSKK